MIYVFTRSAQQARKSYFCAACKMWRYSGLSLDEITADERLVVEAAAADQWRILRGQDYYKETGIDYGTFYTLRCRIGMKFICDRLKLWTD